MLPKTRVTLLRCRELAGVFCQGGGGEQGLLPRAGDDFGGSAWCSLQRGTIPRAPFPPRTAAVPRLTEQARQREGAKQIPCKKKN